MKSRIIRILFFGLCAWFWFCPMVWGDEFIQAPCVIHVSSSISDGKYAPEEIAKIAQDNGISVLIITDNAASRFEYGLRPLRGLIKKTMENPSALTYGIENYLERIKKLNQEFPKMIFIPAVEGAPFYYWTGSFFKNNLTMHNWHNHILAIGLDSAAAYRNLPLISNPRGLRAGIRISKFWPVMLILLGLFVLRRKRALGFFIAVIGLVFLANNWPFYGLKYDQYHGDAGIMPYQNFIDYVGQLGGLTFWAHPEAQNLQDFGSIKIETKDQAVKLAQSQDYTGFAILLEGYKSVGPPGGLWDEILAQYCAGLRKKPVWAIAELNRDYQGNLDVFMKELRNMLLVRGLTYPEVIDALKKGRMYVAQGENAPEFILDRFIIRDLETGNRATLGEELAAKGWVRLEISGRFLHPETERIEIKLIKNGSVIKVYEVLSPFEIFYEEETVQGQDKDYYRLEIRSKDLFVVTNPIFVDKRY